MKKERINATGYNVTFAYAVGAWLQYLRERTEGRTVFQSQINRAALALRHIFNKYIFTFNKLQKFRADSALSCIIYAI